MLTRSKIGSCNSSARVESIQLSLAPVSTRAGQSFSGKLGGDTPFGDGGFVVLRVRDGDVFFSQA